jgi:uncharacterized protein (TIGR04255 family)
VSLGVQFQPVAGLRTPQIGLLWQEFRECFPVVEEHPPLDPVYETFGKPRPVPPITLQIKDFPLVPRVFFLDAAGTSLIQVQQDRFIQNWRKLDDSHTYPRYDAKLRGAFSDAYEKFEQFVARQDLGELTPDQCELTYVNIVAAESGTLKLDQVLTIFSEDYSEEFLPETEGGRVALKYRILGADQGPIGRLHIVAEPALQRTTGEMVYNLTLTARGAPLGTGRDGVFKFLDLGREWIVRGFAAITTRKMHETWRRLS